MALITLAAAMVCMPGVKPVTIEATLLAPITVPPAASIKPYRSALVAGEYTVNKVISGKDPEIKKGGKIRVFRWGILEAKPTALATLKKGAKVKLTVRPLSGWTEMEREYQVDNLEMDLKLSYYVEVVKKK